jgi:hypothetical protein
MSFLAAVVAGVLAGAFTSAAGGPALAVGIAVGVMVYAVTFGAGLLARRHGGRAPVPPRPTQGSPAAVWLRRAETAVRALAERTAAAPAPVRGRLGPVATGGDEALAQLRRIAAQVTAVDGAASRFDVPRLQAERGRLVRDLYDAPSGSERRAQTRAAETAAEQLATYGRLRAAREQLLARLESTALDLEGLVERVDEVVALAAAPGGADAAGGQATALSDRLAALRSGLAETVEVSRRALGS